MTGRDFVPLSKPVMGREELSNIEQVLKSGWWTTGPTVTRFEQELCDYLQHDAPLYAVGLNSCTAALHLGLLAVGIKPGDEVILPTWTFAATAQAVQWVGAIPVLCDVLESDLTIDPCSVEKRITRRTKAILPVHIAGHSYDINGISARAQNHRLPVIEDAAHAIGSSFEGKKIGNYSDLACFSFYATKNMAMGEGGAAVSKNKTLIDYIRKLGYFGINKQAYKDHSGTGSWYYDIEEIGYKYNLDSLHAALGLAQLKELDRMNARRREIARRYRNHLSKKLTLFDDSHEIIHTYHLFMIRLPSNINREHFISQCARKKIGTGVHYIPLHRHSLYANDNPKTRFPVAEKIYQNIVSIPMFPSMSDEDTDYVIDCVNGIVNQIS